MKTATDRAREAIVTAETMFAVEMGAALDLGPAAKMALVVNITAAIRAAVAEERKRLISAQGTSPSGAESRRAAVSVTPPVAGPLRFGTG